MYHEVHIYWCTFSMYVLYTCMCTCYIYIYTTDSSKKIHRNAFVETCTSHSMEQAHDQDSEVIAAHAALQKRATSSHLLEAVSPASTQYRPPTSATQSDSPKSVEDPIKLMKSERHAAI